MLVSLIDLLVAIFGACLGSVFVFLALKSVEIRRRRREKKLGDAVVGPVFLFQGQTLLDATRQASALIAPHLAGQSELDATLHVLSPHFPSIPLVVDLHEDGRQRIKGSSSDGLWIDIDRRGDILRLSVGGNNLDILASAPEVIERDVRLAELSMLRDITHQTPQLVWREDLKGKMLWANHAYLSFCDSLSGKAAKTQPGWPRSSIFPDLYKSISKGPASTKRLSVLLPQQKAEQWFDVTSIRRDGYTLHFANDANAIVRADQDRRNFVQTLTQTFAQLSTGLAIFDRRRQLTMFNPALFEMTQLPIEFLSSRPTLDTVLDKLRESRILPEPKNYASWREQFTALEAAAKDGTYSETWNLPDGQTYRVTGRPHPAGAFAFLFEDVSASVSLTRRFRSDIETGQSVLDTLPEAIAVFSSSGTLVMSNFAYLELWGEAKGAEAGQTDLNDALHVWQMRSRPSPKWASLRTVVHLLTNRKTWAHQTVLDDGRTIACEAVPIANGMTMIKFSLDSTSTAVVQQLTAIDPSMLVAKSG